MSTSPPVIQNLNNPSQGESLSSPELLHQKFVTHTPKAGLNPLVDAAAYLFSIVGKLKQIKSYRHLNKLQKELIQEMNQFQDLIKQKGYSTEYILVSRYALCATLDDIISNTLWGGQGQWDTYSLLNVFNQESLSADRFFVILERIIKEPTQYIDVMELMYICLSLGFKGSYRTTEYGANQIEQITNALYRRIRLHQGDIKKTLTPYVFKQHIKHRAKQKKMSLLIISVTTLLIMVLMFVLLGYVLDIIANQASTLLSHIGTVTHG